MKKTMFYCILDNMDKSIEAGTALNAVMILNTRIIYRSRRLLVPAGEI